MISCHVQYVVLLCAQNSLLLLVCERYRVVDPLGLIWEWTDQISCESLLLHNHKSLIIKHQICGKTMTSCFTDNGEISPTSPKKDQVSSSCRAAAQGDIKSFVSGYVVEKFSLMSVAD